MVIEPLDPKVHDRIGFDCGEPEMNEYLRKTAKQHADRDVGVTHVAVEEVGSPVILGYVTLALKTVGRESLTVKHLPRGEFAVALIAQLAVATQWRSQGIGKRLLYFSLYKAQEVSESFGLIGVALDLLGEDKRGYYEARGFRSLADDRNRLFISMKEIRQLPLGL